MHKIHTIELFIIAATIILLFAVFIYLEYEKNKIRHRREDREEIIRNREDNY